MIIVKVGGGKKIRWNYILSDLKKIIDKGQQVVVVHGASETRDEIALKMGYPTKTVTSPSGVSSVFTDQMALDIFLMSYCGLTNKKIVAQMQGVGINAVGLSGIDGNMWQAKAKPNLIVKEDGKTKFVRGNLSGRVEKVEPKLIFLLLKNGFVPVLSAPALSFESKIVNTDNDWATAVMAGALGAKSITYLFEAPGLLRDFNEPKSKIDKIDQKLLKENMKFAKGRMKKKLLGAGKALDLGVSKIFFGDGRIKNPISKALKGGGTVIL